MSSIQEHTLRRDAPTGDTSTRNQFAQGRVLITGATGFIGSQLLRACIDQAIPVRALVRNAIKARELPRRAQRHYASLSDAASLTGIAKDVQLVIHLGAAMGGGWSTHQQVTVEGTRKLLEECRAAGVRRFIHVSSLYAHETSGLSEGDTVEAETVPLAHHDTSLGNYARGKAQTEHMVRDFCTEHDIAFTIMRPGIVYGPGKTVFEHFGRRFGNTFVGSGDGDQRLPMVCIDSVVDALLRIARSPETASRAYLVVDEDIPRDVYLRTLASASRTTFKQVPVPLGLAKTAARMFQTMRRVTGIRKIPDMTVEKVRSRSLSLVHDTTSLRRDTGWKPSRNLEENLRRAMAAEAPDRRTIRVGFIGAGAVSQLHLGALRGVSGTQLTGVLDVAPGRATSIVPEELAFEDVDDFFERARPDVVHILTPPSTHCDIAIDAMKRGVHVFCEKPLASTMEESQRMIDAARECGVRLGINHNYLFDQRVDRARTMLEQNVIGELRHMDVFWGFDVLRLRRADDAAGQWARHLPGGVLEDILPNPLSIVLALLGREAKLTHHHTYSTGSAADAMDDELRVCIECSERSAHIALSLSAKPDDFSITLYGTSGTLRVDLQDMLLHHLRLCKGPKSVARGLKVLSVNTRALAQLGSNFVRVAARRGSPPADVRPMLQRFYASLLNGNALPASADDGLQVVRMIRSIW